jgi:L-asparaginase
MSTDLIDIMVKAGAKGIVIAGVGDGNMNAGTLEAAKKATNDLQKPTSASQSKKS